MQRTVDPQRDARHAALLALMIAIAVAIATATATTPSLAAAGFLRWHWNIDDNRLAIQGFDPVAYTADGKARIGDSKWETEHEGIRYRFASADNRRAFAADPEKYLPRFGGWCAFGLGLDSATVGLANRRIPADPESFEIIDGRVVLFSRGPGWDARKRWRNGDPTKQLERADAFWRSREALAAAVGEKPHGLHPAAVLETTQFNFFIGEWDSRYKVRVSPTRPDYSPEIRGRWSARYGWDGFAIYDDWVQIGAPPGNSGPAIRSFDPFTRTWVMHYIPINSPMSSVWAMTGEFDDEGELHATMKATDGSGDFLQRVHFINISKDRFSWRSDRSYDEGKTWIDDWGVGENYRIKSDDTSG